MILAGLLAALGIGYVGIRLVIALQSTAARPAVESSVMRDGTPVLFTVRAGASAGEVAADLQAAGLIRSAATFRMEAEVRGVSGHLRVGEYELRRDMSLADILDALTTGRGRRSGLTTLREGWRAEEIARHLEAAGVVRAEAFMDVASGRVPVEGLPVPPGAVSFEGYLFPDSYDFGRGLDPETVVRRLVEEFETKVGPEIRLQAEAHGLTLHQLVTIASIVEREAADASERADIAAVYHNRLRRGMMLQADPTTQYALVPFGDLGVESYWKRTLSGEDLRVESPYNTYRVVGLPPGPICNPGMASIEAAANPSGRPWLYFVARGDGTHLFAQTLDEHLRNVARAGG